MTVEQPNRRVLNTDDHNRRMALVWPILAKQFALPLLVITIIGYASTRSPFVATIVTTCFAILALTTAIWLPLRQKQLWLCAIPLVIIGLLLVIEASLQDTYSNMILPLTDSAQHNFSDLLDVTGLTQTINSAVSGLLLCGLAWFYLQPRSKQNRKVTQAEIFLNRFLAIGDFILAIYVLYGATQHAMHALRL